MYAHIYYEHFDQICALGIEGEPAFPKSSERQQADSRSALRSTAHLNTNYRHFYLFVSEFGLIDKKEMAPLEEFNKAIADEYQK